MQSYTDRLTPTAYTFDTGNSGETIATAVGPKR